jgi:hypothetical protein
MNERAKFIEDLRNGHTVWYKDPENKISGRYLVSEIMDFHSDRTEETPITLIKVKKGIGTYLERDVTIADISQ